MPTTKRFIYDSIHLSLCHTRRNWFTWRSKLRWLLLLHGPQFGEHCNLSRNIVDYPNYYCAGAHLHNEKKTSRAQNKCEIYRFAIFSVKWNAYACCGDATLCDNSTRCSHKYHIRIRHPTENYSCQRKMASSMWRYKWLRVWNCSRRWETPGESYGRQAFVIRLHIP